MSDLDIPPTEAFRKLPPAQRFQMGRPRWMVVVYCAACHGKHGRYEVARVSAPPAHIPDGWQPDLLMTRIEDAQGNIDHERTGAFMCRRHGRLDPVEAWRLVAPAIWLFVDTFKTQHVRVSPLKA